MSIFIGFVPVHVTADQLTNAFSETFDASVLVRLSKEKVNKNDVKYKSATIDLITTSRALDHFLSQMDEYGSNTFIADKNKYRVQYAQERTPRAPQVKQIKPYIM